MNHLPIITSNEIVQYCENHTTQPSQELLELKKETFKLHEKSLQFRMQVGALEGRFLNLIVKLSQATRILELGTFTGYSALAFAEALPQHGKVITLDRDPVNTETAKKFWSQSTHGYKIELALGDALSTLDGFIEKIQNREMPHFDLMFIDADKGNYIHYWEKAFKVVKPNGCILVDNVLWSGRVLDPKEKSDHQIHEFNNFVAQDQRVETIMLPLRDGITLARIK